MSILKTNKTNLTMKKMLYHSLFKEMQKVIKKAERLNIKPSLNIQVLTVKNFVAVGPCTAYQGKIIFSCKNNRCIGWNRF